MKISSSRVTLCPSIFRWPAVKCVDVRVSFTAVKPDNLEIEDEN